MIKNLAGYVAAIITTYVLGAIFVSQGNISRVVEHGYAVNAAQRFEAALHDVTSMTDIYLPLVAVAHLIAFVVATLIIRFVPHLRLLGYTLAGFVALTTMHLIGNMVLGVSAIAPTRDLVGLLAQGIAGAAGGYIFYLVKGAPANGVPT